MYRDIKKYFVVFYILILIISITSCGQNLNNNKVEEYLKSTLNAVDITLITKDKDYLCTFTNVYGENHIAKVDFDLNSYIDLNISSEEEKDITEFSYCVDMYDELNNETKKFAVEKVTQCSAKLIEYPEVDQVLLIYVNEEVNEEINGEPVIVATYDFVDIVDVDSHDVIYGNYLMKSGFSERQ